MSKKFTYINTTQEAEDQYDLLKHRANKHPVSNLGSVAHLVKGALGAGILGAHVAFMNSGFMAGIPLTVFLGAFMCYCLHILVLSARKIYKRAAVPTLSYPEVGECAVAIHTNPIIRKFSKFFRYCIDFAICLDLFGACTCYQLIISKTVKQIVENTSNTSLKALKPGYPDLLHYLLIFMIPIACICLIKQLKVLAPFSVVGNILVLICVFVTVYYSLKENPSMGGMAPFKSFEGAFTFCGIVAFSMSCSGIVIAVENNMKKPYSSGPVLFIGMTLITLWIGILGLFGYSAYKDKCESPVTIHFPMSILPIILKAMIAIQIYITHGINFWVPFNLLFHYIKKCHSEKNIDKWEYFYRALISCVLTAIGILFPNVGKVMSFLGAFCISNMAFIWPVVVWLLVESVRPGLGKFAWKLIFGVILLIIGLLLWIAGSAVSVKSLVEVIRGK